MLFWFILIRRYEHILEFLSEVLSRWICFACHRRGDRSFVAICEDALAIAQGREFQEASPALIFLQLCALWHEVGTVFKNGLSTFSSLPSLSLCNNSIRTGQRHSLSMTISRTWTTRVHCLAADYPRTGSCPSRRKIARPWRAPQNQIKIRGNACPVEKTFKPCG